LLLLLLCSMIHHSVLALPDLVLGSREINLEMP